VPITLKLDAISVVTDPAAPDTASMDRPVRADDLEMLGTDEAYLTAAGFDGKLGTTALLPQSGAVAVAVGLGSDPLTATAVRKAAATLWSAASKSASLSSTLPLVGADDLGADVALQATVEGMLLASYRFDELKGEPAEPAALTEVVLVAPDGVAVEDVLARASAVAEGVALARDLVNRPGGSLTATGLADAAAAAAEATGLDVEVWGPDRLAEERCGGLLGVNAGSTEEPRLVRMTYTPEGESRATIHLVGKGITFDTGGLNLKPFEGMQSMKIDMGGAAAVVGAMRAVAALAPDVTIVGTCCCTDNQPGPTATMPGDVLHIRNGKTVEVLNTDAEGRLVLADGLSLAAEAEPDLIVDLATLTGACLVALGAEYAGLMGNDDAAIARVESAAGGAGENVWHLPLPDEYRKQLDSEVADLRNIGAGRYGGTLTAGLFLENFVADTPWVHLDIAGPVTTDSAGGEFQKGATGFGVRTLLELVSSW